MTDRDENGRFKHGNPGGPGRPKGSNGRGINEFRRLVNGGLEAVVAAVMTNAQSGDNGAAKLILDRMFPVHNFQLAQIEERLAALEDTYGPDDAEGDPGQD